MLGFLRKNLFTLSIVVSVAAAFVWPDFFTQWGDFKLIGLIAPLLMVIMFGMGTTLSIGDFARVAKMPVPVATGVALQFLLMPTLGFCIGKVLGLEPDLAIGCIVIGSVAGGSASNVIAYIAKANVALSVTMTCVSTFLSPFATPFLVKLYAGETVEVDALAMALEIMKITILPTVLGLVVHRVLRRPFERNRAAVERILSLVSMTGICIILAVIMGPAHEKAKEMGLVLIAAAATHNTCGLLAGYWATRLMMRFFPGRITERDCRTIAIEVGMQNGGMATQLAAKFFSPVAALVPNVFGIWMDVSGSVLANFWSRRATAEPDGDREQAIENNGGK